MAIAFQWERISPFPKERLKRTYETCAEMYWGQPMWSPGFYGWVFPKYDPAGLGTGTMQKKPVPDQGLAEGRFAQGQRPLLGAR